MFKDDLNAAMVECIDHPNDLALLKDIKFLCENAIPVVC